MLQIMILGDLYRRHSFKTFLESDNRSELTYTETEHFYFYPSESGSGLSERAVICTVNIPLLVRQCRLVT